ncbi:HEAT repeat domain-containing protein, partial [Klebsiella pneumoniae]|uniref:HEAT repeat domain-containing protein n=1 Tax=Klebsiella pneumoniae TaxID=573 RepID=UPI002731C78E
GVARPLVDLLENRDQGVRMAAIEVLGLIGDGSVAERMLSLLGDEACAQTVLEALDNFGEDVLCDMVSRNLGRDPDQDIYLVY